MARASLGEAAFQEAWLAARTVSDDKAWLTATQLVAEAGSGNHELPVHVRDSALGQLSHREREVAGLIARGLTNRQIATHLVIAERTASNHVLHILDKLSFHSRTQIAVWATEQGLLMDAQR